MLFLRKRVKFIPAQTGSIFAALASNTAEAVLEAVQVAKKYGTVVAYDLNFRTSLWKSQGGKEGAQWINREIAKYVDVMIGNEEDFTACLGFHIEGADEHLTNIQTESLANRIKTAVKEFPNFKVAATTLHNAKTATINDWSAIVWYDGKIYESMNPSTLNTVSTLVPGAGELPKLMLRAPDGARAEIYLHGAHVTSWAPAGGSERLFMSRASQFKPGSPIRGGIPLVFPQFGMTGPLAQHGFARVMPWDFIGAEVVGTGASAVFRLRDTEDSRRLWANAFLAELTVAIGGNQLAATLAITNTGAESFTFTSALHTYFAVTNLAATVVENLAGLRYRDAAAGWTENQQTAPRVDFTGEVNRIYFDTPAELRLIEPSRTTLIRSAGFPDTVIWNPAVAKCATMPDLEPDDYQRFVCVEAAVIGTPIHLAPGARWQGVQTLVA